jgi:hypothetical protein
MADYGSSGEPATELQSLLATGAVGGALQQYITSGLGEQEGLGTAGMHVLGQASSLLHCFLLCLCNCRWLHSQSGRGWVLGHAATGTSRMPPPYSHLHCPCCC